VRKKEWTKTKRKGGRRRDRGGRNIGRKKDMDLEDRGTRIDREEKVEQEGRTERMKIEKEG
jgi:hypothetical protein